MRHFRSEASREPHTKISYFFGGGMFCDGNYGVLVVLFGFSSHTKVVANHSINQKTTNQLIPSKANEYYLLDSSFLSYIAYNHNS